MSEEPPKRSSFEVFGEVSQECQDAIDFAAMALRAKLDDQQMTLLKMFKIRFYKSDKDRGGHVDFEHKEIVFNRDDAAMSLRDSEAYLVSQGIFDPGDTTKELGSISDKPWSTLARELVHESGHVIDKLSGGNAYNRLDVSHSPTKNGKTGSHEALADAFTAWVFDGELSPEAREAVEDMVYRYK